MARVEEALTGFDAEVPTAGFSAALDIVNRQQSAVECRRIDTVLPGRKSNQMLRTFAGGLAHTFNNLLTVIISNSALLQEEVAPDSPARDRLHRIMAMAYQAAEVTRQMVRYAESSKPQLEWLDLSKLIVELDSRFQSAVCSKVFVEYELCPYLPEILADREQLRRLVTTLFFNASEAIGDDVGVIHVRSTAVHADRSMLASLGLDQAFPEGRYIWLQVSDTGSGMDEQTREHLFEPFFSTKFIGRGLGLSEALGIVNEHRGAIWATTGPGQGSVFNVLLPCDVLK